MNTLPSFYTSIYNALASHTDHSVLAYTSRDRVNFDVHPSPTYGYHSIYDLSTVLPELNTTFVLQVSNIYTRQAIALAPCPQREVDLGTGLSLRVVDDARDLVQLPAYEPVFIRADGSFVIWGDDEVFALWVWTDIICLMQSQSETAIPTTTPVAGPPANDGNDVEVLSDLEDFSDIFNFVEYLSPAPAYTSWPEPSEGSLGFTLLQRARSPFSDVTNSSILDSPSTTDPEGVFPSRYPSVNVGEEDEVVPNFPLSIDSRGVSPALSLYCAIPSSAPPVPEQAVGSPFTHPLSVVETSASKHGIDQKAKQEHDEEAARPFPQPIISAKRCNSEAATGNADVALRSAPNPRVLKRTHSAIGIASGSAPARLTIPLPDVQPEEDKRRKFQAIAPAPPPTSTSVSASTPVSAPAPTFPSTPVSTPAPGKPQRRSGNRRRGGGTGKNSRVKHPCKYCPKTFTRLQDQQRHITTSCNASPEKKTVPCPECGSILSRVDAAQRHWRSHANPKCETPEWVSSRT